MPGPASGAAVVLPPGQWEITPDHAAASGLTTGRRHSARWRANLETAQPKNAPFYEHLGFRPIINLVEPTSTLPFWTLRRD